MTAWQLPHFFAFPMPEELDVDEDPVSLDSWAQLCRSLVVTVGNLLGLCGLGPERYGNRDNYCRFLALVAGQNQRLRADRAGLAATQRLVVALGGGSWGRSDHEIVHALQQQLTEARRENAALRQEVEELRAAAEPPRRRRRRS
jgi:hypothetical protein